MVYRTLKRVNYKHGNEHRTVADGRIKMEGFILAIIVTVVVFVIFGRDEEGLTRFQRRQMRRMQQQVRTEDAEGPQAAQSGHRAA
ncbi:MAG: hypothetical protein J6Y57_02195 [Lachnospiraceae bacterium]|nr:hypothetical protein [Lachnospiraceae bacterium]